MQICEGFVAVVVVVAYASYNIIFTVEIWLISTEDGAIVYWRRRYSSKAVTIFFNTSELEG